MTPSKIDPQNSPTPPIKDAAALLRTGKRSSRSISQRLTSLWALFDARNKEFLRDRAALSWNFLFPLLVVVGFGFAFSGKSQDVFKVGVLGTIPQGEFYSTRYLQFVPETDETQLLSKLKRHAYDLVIGQDRYWINASSPKGYLVERLLKGSPEGARLQKGTVEGQEIRYIDWLISGLLAMNMMFSALFGVGYVIVRYRKSGVLKRLRATPLAALDFLLAQIFSRLVLLILVTSLVYAGCHALLKFQMLGSYADLAVVLTLGSICLISLGLLVAALVSSEEFAGGLLNLITWPMMFFSGVWFSLEGLHPAVRALAQLFPLTHVIDPARAIMTEGATLAQVAPHLWALVGMTVLFLGVGAYRFKWE